LKAELVVVMKAMARRTLCASKLNIQRKSSCRTLLDELVVMRQLKRLDFTWPGRKHWDLFNQLAKQPPAPAPLAEEAKQQTF